MAENAAGKRPRDEATEATSTSVETDNRRQDDFFADGEGPPYLVFDGPVPVELTDSIPKATYRSRGQEVKTACHWGQRKLLISEMQLLTYFCEPNTPYWIVYVGAAPGSHLMQLDLMYRGIHEWELIDPGAWDHRYKTLDDEQKKRFNLRSEYFDAGQAYELAERRLVKAGCPALAALYRDIVDEAAETAAADAKKALQERKETSGEDADAARTEEIPIRYVPPLVPRHQGLAALASVASERCKMLFISDVRSGSEQSCKVGDFEFHVYENMRAQAAWADVINPTFAMLKFRLPYSFITKFDHALNKNVTVTSGLPPTTDFRDGTLLLPVWTRPTSTECRHVVPQNSRRRCYHHKDFEDRMFFFNAVLRERVYFRHDFDGHEWVDHRYDGASEVAVVTKFVEDWRAVEGRGVADRAAVLEEVATVIETISTAIGSSFKRAYENRERIHTSKAQRAGWIKATEERLERARKKRSEAVWHRALTQEEEDSSTAQAPYVWALRSFQPSQDETPAPPQS